MSSGGDLCKRVKLLEERITRLERDRKRIDYIEKMAMCGCLAFVSFDEFGWIAGDDEIDSGHYENLRDAIDGYMGAQWK